LQTTAQITIASPELSVTSGLAHRLKHHSAGTLTFTIHATDTHHTTTGLSLKLAPR
jgi:hypothetical protein